MGSQGTVEKPSDVQEKISRIIKAKPPVAKTLSKEVVVDVFDVATLKDPGSKDISHYYCWAKANTLPVNIPRFNVRVANISNKLYKKVIADIQDRKKAFHLNSKGITIIAETAEVRGGKLYINLGDDGGIVDGSRTTMVANSVRETTPDTQYVPLTVKTNVPRSRWFDMASALSSSHQVKDVSLGNFNGEYDSIKKVLTSQPYFDKISWEEGDRTSSSILVERILSYMTAMNINLYPSSGRPTVKIGSAKQPQAAARADGLLPIYRKYSEHYEGMLGLLPDILLLRDYIESNAPIAYNKAFNKRASYLGFVSGDAGGKKEFSRRFSGENSVYAMSEFVVLIMLGAMRPALMKDREGNFKWRGNGRGDAEILFDKAAPQLMEYFARAVKEESKTHATNASMSLARSENAWQSCLEKVIIARNIAE